MISKSKVTQIQVLGRFNKKNLFNQKISIIDIKKNKKRETPEYFSAHSFFLQV